MEVTWKVIWRDTDNKPRIKKRITELKEAIQYAKGLKKLGLKPSVVSANKAYPPTKEQQLKRKPGQMWCPYCINWRKFRLYRIKTPNYVTEAKMRCPICTISTDDYFVRKYNGFIEHITESELVRMLSRG